MTGDKYDRLLEMIGYDQADYDEPKEEQEEGQNENMHL